MEIKIQNLVKKYGKNTVLDIPELTIGSGELVGLVGNNNLVSRCVCVLSCSVVSGKNRKEKKAKEKG